MRVKMATLGSEDLRFLEEQRVGRLAMVDDGGSPHALPVCYAVVNGRLYVPIDAKPKRGNPRDVARLRYLRARPEAALVVDRYSDDWSQLRWLLVRARARILEDGDERAASLVTLEARYPQYAAMRLASLGLPVVALDPTSVRRWSAT